MMENEQPEALRIADALAYCDSNVASRAIAELRRLHAVEWERDELRKAIAIANRDAEHNTEVIEQRNKMLSEMHAERDRFMAQRDRAEADAIVLRFALLGMLQIHTEPAGFLGKYGKDLDKAIAEQQTKIDARVAAAKAALGL